MPHTPWPKQTAFLLLNQLEAFYGGAAGPGKSDGLLMAALQYADIPHYRAMLFRRTYADLALSGALMDRAADWLRGSGSKWDSQEHRWTLPSGARLGFGYCESERDEERYQGMEVQFIGIDEVTQWKERQYRFLFSRLRRLAGTTIPIRMRSASNPGGAGHEWVKARFITNANTVPGRATIRAVMSDNPSLDQAEYVKSLLHLDPVTRDRLMKGDWDVREGGGIFKREWFRIAPGPLPEWCKRVRYWDKAATEGGGDRTAGVRMAIDPSGVFVVEHVIKGQWAPGRREQVIETTAATDPPGTVVAWEEEGGSAGKSDTVETSRRLARYTLFADHKTGRKVVRWGPLASQMELGNVVMLSGEWNEGFVDELTVVNEEEEGFDDQADAAAGAYLFLTQFGPYRGPPGRGEDRDSDDDDDDVTIMGERGKWSPLAPP